MIFWEGVVAGVTVCGSVKCVVFLERAVPWMSLGMLLVGLRCSVLAAAFCADGGVCMLGGVMFLGRPRGCVIVVDVGGMTI